MKINTKCPRGNTGRTFELTIMASQGNVVRLEHLPSCGAKFVGKGRIVRLPICCDFAGAVVNTGRAIFFDAKSCELVTRFPVGDPSHFPPHQRAALIRFGQAGAISGLLVEAAKARTVYWLGWRHLLADVPSLAWDDPRMVRVAEAGMSINFSRVVTLAAEGT